MLKIALTGSKFSGKKYAVSEFKKLGVKVFDADVAIKYILQHNIEVIYNAKKLFGDKSPNLYLDSKFFSSDEKMIKLLEFIEDELFSIFDNFINKNKTEHYIIFKCSCLIEMQWEKHFDKVINVFASNRVTKDRNYYLYKKTNSPLYDLTNEMDIFIKNGSADIVIHNYDTMNVPNQIKEINQKLLFLPKTQTK